jgi:ribose/xylose/arabinose/galactoside ABC-type transport system permease subunit
MRQHAASILNRIEASAILGSTGLALLFIVATKGIWIGNFLDTLDLTSIIGIVSIGQAFLMITGEFDLSVGSVFAFIAVVFVSLMDLGLGMFAALVCAMLLSCCVGLVNGLLTLRFKVQSMIVTLGAMFAYRGLVYILTSGVQLSVPHDLRASILVKLLGGKQLGFSSSILILVVVMMIFVMILSTTRYGNHVFAVGADAWSAQSCGISPEKTRLVAFIICSALAGFSGILVTCKELAVYSTTGQDAELETIAAAVIGGCSLSGGVGSIWGTVLGAFIISSLRGGLLMMGAPSYWYVTFVGMILILFMVISRLIRGFYGTADQNGPH